MDYKKYFNKYKNKKLTRLNYISFSAFRIRVSTPPSLLNCYKTFFSNCVTCFKNPRQKAPKCNEIVFFSTTMNNNLALQPIWTKLNKNIYELWLDDGVFPQKEVCFYSLLNILKFHFTYLFLSNDDKKVVRTFFWEFIRTYGYYTYIKKYIKRNKRILKLIVMANDHSLTNRTLIEVANKYKIKTLYVQHASVTEKFPPLVFTYSFLDGNDAYCKYKTVSDIQETVFLSGNPRYDDLFSVSKNNSNIIGIAVNELDNYEKCIELANHIINNTNYDVIVRPHPRVSLDDKTVNSLNLLGIRVSDSKIEKSLEFISKLRILIANESSIHLDAAMLGIPSILYNFSNNTIIDWYSYIRNGLIKICYTFSDVMNNIKNINTVDDAIVKRYNAAFNTSYSGQVASIIAEFINCIIYKKHLDDFLKKYFTKQDNNLYVYK